MVYYYDFYCDYYYYRARRRDGNATHARTHKHALTSALVVRHTTTTDLAATIKHSRRLAVTAAVAGAHEKPLSPTHVYGSMCGRCSSGAGGARSFGVRPRPTKRQQYLLYVRCIYRVISLTLSLTLSAGRGARVLRVFRVVYMPGAARA